VWNKVLLDVTQCSVINRYRRFGGTYYLHAQGRKNRVKFNSFQALIDFFYDDLLANAQYCGPQKGGIFVFVVPIGPGQAPSLSHGPVGLSDNLEDGRNKFLRNVGIRLQDLHGVTIQKDNLSGHCGENLDNYVRIGTI
jgi:hypothetical protein